MRATRVQCSLGSRSSFKLIPLLLAAALCVADDRFLFERARALEQAAGKREEGHGVLAGETAAVQFTHELAGQAERKTPRGLAADDDPWAADQPDLQGRGRQRPAADGSGPAAEVGAGADRPGGEHHGAPTRGVDHRPCPRVGLGRAVRLGAAAAGRQPAERPAQHHPPLPAARAGQLRGLPLGLHRGHPHRHRHPLPLLPLPGQAGAGGLRPLELLPGAVHPGHPARRPGVGGPVRGPPPAPAGRPGAGARHSGAWVPQELRRRQATSAASGRAWPANASGCWRPTWPR